MIIEICIHLFNDSLREPRIYADINSIRTSCNSLARLSRTCKTTHTIVEPILAELKKRKNEIADFFEFSFVRYARDILRDRELALRERHFTADHWNPIGPVEKSDCEMLDRAIRSLGVTHHMPSKWLLNGNFDGSEREACGCGGGPWFRRSQHECQKLKIMRQSVLLNTILRILPNLKSIELPDEFYLRLRPQSPLSLREATLGSYSGDFGDHAQDDGWTLYWCDAASFASLFNAAPSLEELTISNCREFSEPVRLGNLCSLEITNSCLSAESVQNLLSGCTRLERFVYRSCAARFVDDPEELAKETWPKDFVNCLQCVTHPLRELRLHTTKEFRDCDDYHVDGDGLKMPRDLYDEDFRPFTKLRTKELWYDWEEDISSPE
ncbi:hypothetical protein F5Y16DRAFT_419233 [Xylariaceae sp. FL0255]|nr:hypothetical protein F5Y16DRAFT_419233 [Xylariaceae sp. FL0255]